MKIYLDNCCFNRPYDNQSIESINLETEFKLLIQSKIMDNELELICSFMLDYENSANPYIERRKAIAEWKQIAKNYVHATECIRKRGQAIETLTGIKSKDALHLACAIIAECEYFITTDRKFLKKAQIILEIKTVNPIAFLTILQAKP